MAWAFAAKHPEMLDKLMILNAYASPSPSLCLTFTLLSILLFLLSLGVSLCSHLSPLPSPLTPVSLCRPHSKAYEREARRGLSQLLSSWYIFWFQIPYLAQNLISYLFCLPSTSLSLSCSFWCSVPFYLLSSRLYLLLFLFFFFDPPEI